MNILENSRIGDKIMYDFMFNWLGTSTKEERHCEKIESFAKNYPSIFMEFHEKCVKLSINEKGSEAYIQAKMELVELFNDNKEVFEPVLKKIKTLR